MVQCRRLFWILATLMLVGSAGCRQRAVTELYVEQMAQRNRALEDLVYDFDAENRAMEFELEDLRRTNAQLQGRLQELQRQSSRIESSPSDRGPLTNRTETNRTEKVRPETIRSETIRSESTRPESKNKNNVPAPLKLPPGRSGEQDSLKLEPPEVILPKKSNEAEPLLDSAPVLPSPEPLRKEPSDLLPDIKPAPQKLPESILPEAKLPLQPAGERESLLKTAPLGLPASDADASSTDRKIQLPAGTGTTPESSSGVIQTSATQVQSKPLDARVREIDWHPTMCRSQNTDGKPGDDGLYLVMVPRNSAGQFVPTTGKMTIVVEETLADGTVARIGRYEYTAEELKEHLEPVGSAPGLHIPIRWSERVPSGTSVDVYAKFSMADGTTMVNRRSISLRKIVAGGPSTWTPR